MINDKTKVRHGQVCSTAEVMEVVEGAIFYPGIVA